MPIGQVYSGDNARIGEKVVKLVSADGVKNRIGKLDKYVIAKLNRSKAKQIYYHNILPKMIYRDKIKDIDPEVMYDNMVGTIVDNSVSEDGFLLNMFTEMFRYSMPIQNAGKEVKNE